MAELIERYLPKASTGTRTAFIPGKLGAGSMLAATDSYPMPRLRPSVDGLEVAAAAPPAAIAPATLTIAVMTAEGDTTVVEDNEIVAVEAPVATGWKIQIAATPTRSAAESLLERARSEAGQVLADASAYTEPVTAGQGTLYRARFGGFADGDEARDACAFLVKHDFACLALTN
jgi:cell division septation protein DedD